LSTLKIKPYSQVIKKWKEGKTNAVPSNIKNVDEMIGGIVPGFLFVIWGESGSGKTLFCCNAIKNTLKRNISSKILYSDFKSNLRLKTLEKMNCDLDRINFFQPKNLVEQIVFFQTLQEGNCDYDLIIIDSVFGSPLDQLKYFSLERKLWSAQILSFLLVLKSLASKLKIPIILTCHTSDQDQILEKDLLEGVAPANIFLNKDSSKFLVQFYFYSEKIGESEFLPPF